MTPKRCEADALSRLAGMPFLDRLELAALSGWSRGAVYDAVAQTGRTGDGGSLPPRLPPGVPPPAATPSPPPEWSGWPSWTRNAPGGTPFPSTALSQTNGGGGCWNAWTPWLSSTAWPRPSIRSITPWYPDGTGPCPWTPPWSCPTAGVVAVVRQGNTCRPHRLRQAPLAAGAVDARQRRADAAARRGCGCARPEGWQQRCPDASVPGPGERRRFRRSRGRRLAHPLRSPRPSIWLRRWPTPTRPGPGPCESRRNVPRCPTPWTPTPTACCRPCSSPWRSGPWTCWPIGPGCRLDTWEHCLGVKRSRLSQMTHKARRFGPAG